MSKYEYLIDEACFNTTAENADLKIWWSSYVQQFSVVLYWIKLV